MFQFKLENCHLVNERGPAAGARTEVATTAESHLIFQIKHDDSVEGAHDDVRCDFPELAAEELPENLTGNRNVFFNPTPGRRGVLFIVAVRSKDIKRQGDGEHNS